MIRVSDIMEKEIINVKNGKRMGFITDIDMDINEILTLRYDYIENLIWMPISERRKQASVLALLTTRNAIHKFLKDWKRDTFDMLIKGNMNVC